MILDDIHTKDAWDIATALPAFPEFDVSETSTQATRWKKWLSRFQNLLVAMNVTNKPRQRALLLHYAGAATNEIFDTLPNTTVGEGDDPLEKAVQALTNYFHSQTKPWVRNLCFSSSQARRQWNHFSISHQAETVGRYLWIWWCRSWNQNPNSSKLQFSQAAYESTRESVVHPDTTAGCWKGHGTFENTSR